MVERWYVYQVCSAGYILYIGKGSGTRYLASAKRHSGIAGILQYFKREKDALNREIELIKQFSPPLNKSKGGEGYSTKPTPRVYDYSSSERIRAYSRADKSGGYLNILIAACHARTDLNSRGIKGWPAEDRDQELADPRVGEAIRRLNDWRLYPPPASLRSIISWA